MVMKIDYGNKARYSKFSFLISDSKLCKYVGCVVGAFSPLVRPRTWTIVYQESEAEPFFSSRTLVTADSKLLTPTRAVISIKCGELYDCWLAITCSCQQTKHYYLRSYKILQDLIRWLYHLWKTWQQFANICRHSLRWCRAAARWRDKADLSGIVMKSSKRIDVI